ncbi:MAG: hypothetical protein JAZ12_02125 [Candidatus Thiodiazotropha taylori]|nr:hypothetical protein [Candidatus Thiodiazotropha taylori]
MDTETTLVITKLLDEISSNNGVVTAAIITVGGMLIVSFLSFISQLMITNRVVKSERDNTISQINTERYIRQHENWEKIIVENIIGLLKTCNPELNPDTNPILITEYALKIQLQLNTDDPNQRKVSHLVNELSLKANDCIEKQSASELLEIHADLLEATKPLIYRPKFHA